MTDTPKPITFERDGVTWMVRVHSRTAGKSHAEDHAATPDDLRAVGWVPADEKDIWKREAYDLKKRVAKALGVDPDIDLDALVDRVVAERAAREKAEKQLALAVEALRDAGYWAGDAHDNAAAAIRRLAAERERQRDERTRAAAELDERRANPLLCVTWRPGQAADEGERCGTCEPCQQSRRAEKAEARVAELERVVEEVRADAEHTLSGPRPKRKLDDRDTGMQDQAAETLLILAKLSSPDSLTSGVAAPPPTGSPPDPPRPRRIHVDFTGSPPAGNAGESGSVMGDLLRRAQSADTLPLKAMAVESAHILTDLITCIMAWERHMREQRNAGESAYITTRKSSLQVGVDEALRVTPPDGRCELVSVAVTGNEVLFFWRRAAEGASGG